MHKTLLITHLFGDFIETELFSTKRELLNILLCSQYVPFVAVVKSSQNVTGFVKFSLFIKPPAIGDRFSTFHMCSKELLW